MDSVSASPAARRTALLNMNGDGRVDSADLAALLASWGDCGPGEPCSADLTGDGTVNAADLAALLAAWGVCE